MSPQPTINNLCTRGFYRIHAGGEAMAFQITIEPSSRVFAAEEGEAILAAALRQGLLLPYGCRNGHCGACRGKVIEGSVEHGEAQLETLSAADRAAGEALFCCARARSDLRIAGRELTSARELTLKTLPARVQTMRLAAPDVMIVELKLPSAERLQFFAGQYIDIVLKDGRRRSFSLANAPHDDALLELHIRRTGGGGFTEHVFTTMKARDMLRINGPLGGFYLREDSARPIVLVAGGTGFAPIKAIVEHALAEGSTRPMTLYWGGKARADLYQLELAERWAAGHAHFRFVPVLSGPPAETWNGRRGLVHRAVMEDFPDLSAHQAYVCGSPAMVAAARADFVGQCRLPGNELFADSFDPAVDGG